MEVMTRRRRTRILVEGSPELRREFAAAIREGHAVVELAPPEPSLVMAKMRETAKRSLFYLGEVLVTEAKVRLDDTMGLGIIAGDRPEAALELAVIDAAFNAHLAICGTWQSRLEAEEQRLAESVERREARLLQTRVAFQRMDSDWEETDGA
jgi:alpha-D-ribose 1-methylphosphonate 5-triphosphate synthase subunit PhnG